MRTIRILAAGLGVVALLPAAGFAQSGRSFDNSWFWGVKGGVALIEAGGEKTAAPMGGIDWLITRQHTALNLSVEQAFFDKTSGIFDPSVAGSVRPVAIKDMRRYSLTMIGIPKAFGAVRPYAGIGLALNVIRKASPEGTFTSTANQDSVFTKVNDQSSRVSFVATLGVQAQYSRVSLFGQVSSMPTRDNFLLNGSPTTTLLEAGIRYNIGDAIEKMK
jgi:hypothetical protein